VSNYYNASRIPSYALTPLLPLWLMSVVCRHLGSSAPTNSLKCNDQPSLSLVGPPPGESLPKPEGHVHLDFLVNGLLARRLKLAPTWFIFALPITEGHGRVGHASGYWLVPRNKIVPIGDLGHLLTLTLTSDDLESHIVMNVSSTCNIVPSFIEIGRSRFWQTLKSRDSITRRKFKNPAWEILDILV